jgi:hypothetical protein
MEEWRCSSTILNFGTRCRWEAIFTLPPLYPRGSSPRYPLDRLLGGPQSRAGWCGEERKLAPAGNRTTSVKPVAGRSLLHRIFCGSISIFEGWGNKGLEEICVDFVKGKVVPRRLDPLINFGTRLKRVVSYTLRPLCFLADICGTYFIGGYVWRVVVLDAVEGRKNLLLRLVALPTDTNDYNDDDDGEFWEEKTWRRIDYSLAYAYVGNNLKRSAETRNHWLAE